MYNFGLLPLAILAIAKECRFPLDDQSFMQFSTKRKKNLREEHHKMSDTSANFEDHQETRENQTKINVLLKQKEY
jgi:hypothetical protein